MYVHYFNFNCCWIHLLSFFNFPNRRSAFWANDDFCHLWNCCWLKIAPFVGSYGFCCCWHPHPNSLWYHRFPLSIARHSICAWWNFSNDFVWWEFRSLAAILVGHLLILWCCWWSFWYDFGLVQAAWSFQNVLGEHLDPPIGDVMVDAAAAVAASTVVMATEATLATVTTTTTMQPNCSMWSVACASKRWLLLMLWSW